MGGAFHGPAYTRLFLVCPAFFFAVGWGGRMFTDGVVASI
jgi:hypothetical protein